MATKDKSDEKVGTTPGTPSRVMWLYGTGPLADQTSHQAFQFLIFVFYYAVVGVNVNAIMWAFIAFAVWDSVNDPLLGPISDRTRSRFGRRRFWVLVSLVPFALVNLLLFTPPGRGASDAANVAYMLVTIMAYDFFYTLFTLQEFAIFPEMFRDSDDRRHAAMVKNVLTVAGVILGFVLPTVIISPMVPTTGAEGEIAEISGEYRLTGAILFALVLAFGSLFFKFGRREEPSDAHLPSSGDTGEGGVAGGGGDAADGTVAEGGGDAAGGGAAG
ncbi:MAG: MFS transporter, partial [Promethearchaeota archaeon]